MRSNVLALAYFASAAAIAQDLALASADVCGRDGYVDKEHMAARLLQVYPVSALALPANGQPVSSPRQFLASALQDPDRCKAGCAAADRNHLAAIRRALDELLSSRGSGSFEPTNVVDPGLYLEGTNAQNGVRCVAMASTAPALPPPRPFPAPDGRFAKAPEVPGVDRLRLRGSPDQLDIARSQENDFAATDKAKIAYLNDTQAGTKSTSILGYLGYALPVIGLAPGERAEVIPYVGVNRAVVKVSPTSTETPSTTSTYDVGALAYFFLKGGDIGGQSVGHQLNLRPDYLSDTEAGSRLLSLNVEYLPVVSNIANAFFKFDKSDPAWLEFIVAGKAGGGHWVRKGDDDDAVNRRDFVRLGGRVGFAVVSDLKRTDKPIDFTATYTSLGAISGGPSIDYFKTGLTFSFTPDRFFGVTIGYSHGRREDTAQKEEQFSVELSGRY